MLLYLVHPHVVSDQLGRCQLQLLHGHSVLSQALIQLAQPLLRLQPQERMLPLRVLQPCLQLVRTLWALLLGTQPQEHLPLLLSPRLHC